MINLKPTTKSWASRVTIMARKWLRPMVNYCDRGHLLAFFEQQPAILGDCGPAQR